MIRTLKASEIHGHGLNQLPPVSWNFDYEQFLVDYLSKDFFHAFIMIQDKKVIGTGNVFVKEKVGWLANIIIDKQYRCQGLGFKLTKFLVDFLHHKACETQLLIATELGEAVYRKIGFKKLTDYHRFESDKDKDFNCPNSIRALADSDLKALYELDREANDENRTHFIDKFYRTGLGYFNRENELLGFYLPDFGRGLVLARDEQTGMELLKLKHAKKGNRTLLPTENENGIKFLESIGLQKGDKCSRMILGKENNWKPTYIYSYGSGYSG